nr:hypothetical protein [Tanacetum cinerariifolium]
MVDEIPVMVTKAATYKVSVLDGAVVAPTQTREKVLVVLVRTAVQRRSKIVMKPRPWSLIICRKGYNGLSIFYNIWRCSSGCRIIYFHAMYQHSHIMHLLIEASASKGNRLPIPPSNFFGLFYLKVHHPKYL